MCGIAGFFGQFGPALLSDMGARITHRGPDGEGTFFDDAAGIGLVHRRLAIIDLSSAGHQPMTSHDGRFIICYNGEVYNSPELRREMERDGVNFRGHSDTEVVLELLARRGVEQLGRINGIFAFALWDRKTRCLHLVRDGLGVKPLYVAQTPKGMLFSSEMKALMACNAVDRSLDPAAVASYLTYLYSPGERTMLRSVRKVEPGVCLTFNAGGGRKKTRFYDLPTPAPQTMRDRTAVEGTRSVMETAVERQLLADVEIGAFLSGGLDSSGLVAMAKRRLPDRRMSCFTIDYKAKPGEEDELISDLPYARKAASHLDVNLHEVQVDSSMADDFAELLYILDEPQADPAALSNLYIARLARKSGIKVLLSGAGGDDVFTGYRRHQAARFDGIVAALPMPARSFVASAADGLPLNRAFTRRLRKWFGTIAESDASRIARMFEWLSPELTAHLLRNMPEGLPADIRAPMLESASHPTLRNGVERALRLDQRYFLTDHNLNYTDKTGMAAGVEIRVPFLDPEVIDWASKLPLNAKIRRGTTKWALRKAFEPFLPHDIIYRPKTGFGIPLRSWLRDQLKPLLDDALSRSTIEHRGIFDYTRVQALRQATERGELDGSYTLLALASVELWCRRVLDT